jgi:hypothetical protein
LTDFLLTFVVPSGIARVVIMASIALGLAEAFKSGPGSNVSRGMFLILSYTAKTNFTKLPTWAVPLSHPSPVGHGVGAFLRPERWHEEHSSPGRNCAKT